MVKCCGSTATLLRDGKVLVIGYDDTGELYDPDLRTWTVTGKMTTPRHSHTAILAARAPSFKVVTFRHPRRQLEFLAISSTLMGQASGMRAPSLIESPRSIRSAGSIAAPTQLAGCSSGAGPKLTEDGRREIEARYGLVAHFERVPSTSPATGSDLTDAVWPRRYGCVAPPDGFEPPTPALGRLRSIH